MIRVLATGICLLASAAAAFAGTSRSTYFVTAKVPSPATFESFVNGTFRETVRCQSVCRVQTEVLIRAGAARKLGFNNVKGKLHLVATNNGTLRAKTPTKMRLFVTREAKRRLLRSKSPVALFASVQAFPTKRPGVNYSVAWTSLLVGA